MERITDTETQENAAVPTDEITVINLRYEPPAIAHGMDVDRVHGILRAAEAGDTRDLFALYRDVIIADSHIQCEISKRKLAVIGDTMAFIADDEKIADDVEAANAVKDMASSCKSWLTSCAHLLDGCLYPVALLEKVFSATGNARAPFALSKLISVPHYLLDYTQGSMRIYDVDQQSGAILSTSHPVDPSRYIVHRGHLLSSPDNWGGPLRSILFWWLLSAMDREWWARFLDRYGSPFMVGTYDRGDKDSRSVLERAFALSVKLGGLVISDGTKVELKEAAASTSGDAYGAFLEICQKEKSKLILGQTLSAESESTGLGSGVSQQHEEVRQDIRKFDAKMLSATLRDQLFTQFCQINRIRGAVPTMIWGSDTDDEIKSTVDLLNSLSGTELELTDEAISTISIRTGLSLRRRTGGARTIPHSTDSHRELTRSRMFPPPRF